MNEEDEGTFRASPGVRGGKRGRVWNKGTKTLICSRSYLGLLIMAAISKPTCATMTLTTLPAKPSVPR